MPPDSTLPSISVVIPVYHSTPTLLYLLESIQRYAPGIDEVVIIEDGPDSNAEQALDTFQASFSGSVVYRCMGRQAGAAAARNMGAKAAKSTYLWMLDSDTQLLPTTWSRVQAILGATPPPEAVSGMYSLVPGNPGRFSLYKASFIYWSLKDLGTYDSFEASCGLIKRQIFLDLGGFHESYQQADVEDFEFGYRLRPEQGIAFDPQLQVQHRFPSFTENWKKYFRRSRMWIQLFWERKQFDRGAATGREAMVQLLGTFTCAGWIAGAACPPLRVAALVTTVSYVLFAGPFLQFVLQRYGPFFAAYAAIIHAVSSIAVTTGALWGTGQWIANNAKKNGRGDRI